MKFVDEYRDPDAARRLSAAIQQLVTRPWTIMEVCGGQTHAIVRFGLDELLPDGVELVHGPGCPVCVTPVHLIDAAIQIAGLAEVTLFSFGDMLRVPGSQGDLFSAKSSGADVRVAYSPLDALKFAQAHPERQVVFFAVGFETTAPANAMAVHLAHRQETTNFSVIVSHVLVPPAMQAILDSPHNRVQGFLAAGHVCAVMGYEEYEPLAARYKVPIVVTGFEPLDILQGVHMCLIQLEAGRAAAENQYARVVNREGNATARKVIRDVFEVVPRAWRGIGDIPASGFGLREAYASYDALQRFAVLGADVSRESTQCISGQILQGLKKPHDCPAFGSQCTPESPLGATMVSNEGACAAYFHYRSRARV